MTDIGTPGTRFRTALEAERPLQLVGAVNAYSALLAEHAGFRGVYLSGAGVANASLGLPDLAVTTLHDVVIDVRRITSASPLPLLVDADTGFGNALMIGRAVREIAAAGAAGLHLEDQVADKRCGHRPNKGLVSTQEMVSRLRAAAGARPDPGFVIMARTDAFAGEGLDGALRRIERYIEAGADMLFPEALTELEQYRRVADATGVPVLANITEFGETPLFTLEELRQAGVAIALYPLTAFRAMAAAAESAYATLRREGTQRGIVDRMQTRARLYEHLNYIELERRMDSGE
jgi:methylisocitrate lyase